jgi:hypothetical protein
LRLCQILEKFEDKKGDKSEAINLRRKENTMTKTKKTKKKTMVNKTLHRKLKDCSNNNPTKI